MVIGQSVINVRAISPAYNEPFGAENPQPLGNGREFLSECRHQPANTHLSRQECVQELEPWGIAKGTEQPGSPVESTRAWGRVRDEWPVFVKTNDRSLDFVTRFHQFMK
jgi:hypothetical protein